MWLSIVLFDLETYIKHEGNEKCKRGVEQEYEGGESWNFQHVHSLKAKAYALVWTDHTNNQGSPVQRAVSGKFPKYTTKTSVKET